ncbi:alpha/beta fold hydrolase [Ensifer soli]|uniref:alpha/beta fold hydrolase n=1 Tax=Ciceribacter sp. sgz301302 TaxID=3342379 RepID=UPI0035B93530
MSAYVADDGCRIHYEVSGEGPPLLLLPGLGGDGRFWSGVAPLLAERYRVIVADHRGAGRSDRPDGTYTIGRIARDVLGILDAESIGGARLVGHSTGGAVVQTLALDWPERVEAIVISGSWSRPDARFRMIFSVREALLAHGLTEAYQTLTHVLGHDAAWLSGRETALTEAAARAGERLAPLSVTIARIRMLLDFDRLADLGAIRCPTLVIGGSDDIMVPLYLAEATAAAIPGAHLETMTGGHFYPAAHPAEFAARVETFLRQQDRNR